MAERNFEKEKQKGSEKDSHELEQKETNTPCHSI